MDILVCIKQVPTSSEVEMDEATGVLKRDGTAGKVNPYDLHALEMAFALREAHGGSVQVLSMGPGQARQALLEALHMGADSGTLLNDAAFAGADVLATARTLAAGVRRMGHFDLILCGKQTTDGDTAQVGAEMAELLGVEHACYIYSARVEGNGLVVAMNLGDTVLVQRMPLPCLLTVEKDANTPRLPSYLRSLAVVEEACITSLGLGSLEGVARTQVGLSGSPTQVVRIFPPQHRAGKQMLRGDAACVAAQVYDILRDGKYI